MQKKIFSMSNLKTQVCIEKCSKLTDCSFNFFLKLEHPDHRYLRLINKPMVAKLAVKQVRVDYTFSSL